MMAVVIEMVFKWKLPIIVLLYFFLLHIQGYRSEDIQAQSPTTPSNQPDSTTTAGSPCFYAEEELCRNASSEIDDQSPCQCISHPTIPKSLVCCNITDISRVISCAPKPTKDNNTTSWLNIHIRNATLKEFDISHNFWKLTQSLSVTNGDIKKITNEFTKFSRTKCLNVSNNNLTEIYPRAFTNLTQLQVLDISRNNLSRIPNLSVQTNLTVDIRGNSGMLCDSVLDSIERSALKFIEPDDTFCLMNQTFNWFTSTDSVPLIQLESMKQLNSECPSIPGHGKCKCEAEQMDYEKNAARLNFRAKVDCSGLGLTELPKQLPSYTVSLNVSNNNITSISNNFQDYPSYSFIRKLDADNNQITKMEELEGSAFILSFESLYLRKNKIDKIPEYLLTNTLENSPDGRRLYLGGNKLTCDCNSAKVLRLWLLARHNSIPDYDKILCRNLPQAVVELSEMKLCQSPHDWTDYTYYLIACEVILLMALVLKVSYDYWVFKTAGYLPWPASKMPKLPCDWLCES